MTKTPEIAEFGDFQTPRALAEDVCRLLASRRISPASIVEPTCGKGAFLSAALKAFPDASAAFGFDINAGYVSECRQALAGEVRCRVAVADFFKMDWHAELSAMAEPILVVGNPPWVTSSALSVLRSANLPTKSNSRSLKGLDAKTGKSNFDISEWMLLHYLEWLDGHDATLAMLCKTNVARKVLLHSWKHNLQIGHAEIRRIDAANHFNAAVDACLFCCSFQQGTRSTECLVYEELDGGGPPRAIGYHDGRLVSDIEAFGRWQHLRGNSAYRWRSGVKHDCSKVMELREHNNGFENGLNEVVDIEPSCVYPMLKSSELANGRTKSPNRWMIVTQKEIGQATSPLENEFPKTWQYLISHAGQLDNRRSSIYRNRPRFSVFGVGGYSFAPWKIAVSGFYKSLRFACIGPYQDKPIVMDDTSYLLACRSRNEAEFLYEILSSGPAQEFYSSLIFWDAKRPITTDLLAALSLEKLADELGRREELESFRRQNPWTVKHAALSAQPTLFD